MVAVAEVIGSPDSSWKRFGRLYHNGLQPRIKKDGLSSNLKTVVKEGISKGQVIDLIVQKWQQLFRWKVQKTIPRLSTSFYQT